MTRFAFSLMLLIISSAAFSQVAPSAFEPAEDSMYVFISKDSISYKGQPAWMWERHPMSEIVSSDTLNGLSVGTDGRLYTTGKNGIFNSDNDGLDKAVTDIGLPSDMNFVSTSPASNSVGVKYDGGIGFRATELEPYRVFLRAIGASTLFQNEFRFERSGGTEASPTAAAVGSRAFYMASHFRDSGGSLPTTFKMYNTLTQNDGAGQRSTLVVDFDHLGANQNALNIFSTGRMQLPAYGSGTAADTPGSGYKIAAFDGTATGDLIGIDPVAMEDGNDFVSDVQLNGTDLDFTGSGGAFNSTVALASLQDGTGTDDQNISGSSFNTGNGDLTIGIEDGTNQTVSLDGRYLTAEVDGSTFNELSNLNLASDILTLTNPLTGGNQVDLSSYAGGDDGYIGDSGTHTSGGNLNMDDNSIIDVVEVQFSGTASNNLRATDGSGSFMRQWANAGLYWRPDVDGTGTDAAYLLGDRFISNVNLGIGTTSPSYPLTVYRSSFGIAGEFRINDGTNNPRLRIDGNSEGMVLNNTYSSSANALQFQIGGTEKMRLEGNNLGIGTTSPAHPLDVDGTIQGSDILLGDGSESAPSISWSSDSNTGIYRAGADEMAITTGGSNAMVIDGDNVGIGTDTPFSPLEVVPGTDWKFYVDDLGTQTAYDPSGAERHAMTVTQSSAGLVSTSSSGRSGGILGDDGVSTHYGGQVLDAEYVYNNPSSTIAELTWTDYETYGRVIFINATAAVSIHSFETTNVPDGFRLIIENKSGEDITLEHDTSTTGWNVTGRFLGEGTSDNVISTYGVREIIFSNQGGATGYLGID